jgi:DNA polymerase-3 subunit gamma/tau
LRFFKFLFATTDPQKLPVTILSRCLQFNLKNLNPQLIQSYLQKVLEEEQIAFDEEALWQLASAAAGSMRDALTLVDQAIAYCQGEIRRDAVIEMLGVPQHQQITRLLEAMAANSVADALAVVAQLAEQTPDYANTLDSLLSALHRIALAQLLPEALDNSFGDRDSLQQLAGKFSAEDIQLYYQIGNKGREELRLATDLRAAFEMLLIRMLVFSPRFADLGADAGAVQQTTSQNEQADPAQDPEQKKKPLTEAASEREAPEIDHQAAATEAVPPPPVPASDSVSVEEEVASEAKAIDPPEPTALAASEEAARTVANEAATATEARVKPEPSSGSTGADDSTAESTTEELAVTALGHEDWLRLYPQLGVSGIVGNVLANCVWCGVRDGQLRLQLDEGQSAVFNEEMLPRLEQALNAHFGSELSLQVEICQVDQETAAARAQRLRAESHQAMVRDFQEDEQVRALLERFSGSLATDSIVPLDKKTGA